MGFIGCRGPNSLGREFGPLHLSVMPRYCSMLGGMGRILSQRNLNPSKEMNPCTWIHLNFVRYDIGLRAGVQIPSENEAEHLHFWDSNTSVQTHFRENLDPCTQADKILQLG